MLPQKKKKKKNLYRLCLKVILNKNVIESRKESGSNYHDNKMLEYYIILKGCNPKVKKCKKKKKLYFLKTFLL